MKFIQILFTVSLVVLSVSSCDTRHNEFNDSPLDIMFLVDSSGSVFDAEYLNWQSELDLVSNIVKELPAQSRAGLINFSGCGPGASFQDCIAEGKFKTMIELDEFEANNWGPPSGLHEKIKAIGPDDFNGGWTWTNQALTIALDEFKTKSKTGSKSHFSPNRIIVLITDGYPQPDSPDMTSIIPCDSNTAYISQTLMELRDELDVVIITVGINVDPEKRDQYLTCMTDNVDEYFFEGDFTTLPSLSDPISQLICDESKTIICEDPETMVYDGCGSCDKTCDDPNPICIAVCQTKCDCKSPTDVYTEGKCVSIDEC